MLDDLNNDHACVGRIALATFVDKRPENYNDVFMVEVALFINKAYRNQHYCTAFAKDVLASLKQMNLLKKLRFALKQLPATKQCTKLQKILDRCFF